jgi:hypothetical protein
MALAVPDVERSVTAAATEAKRTRLKSFGTDISISIKGLGGGNV